MSNESMTLNVMILFCLVIFFTFLYDLGLDITGRGGLVPKPRKVIARGSREPYYVNYPNISGRAMKEILTAEPATLNGSERLWARKRENLPTAIVLRILCTMAVAPSSL